MSYAPATHNPHKMRRAARPGAPTMKQYKLTRQLKEKAKQLSLAGEPTRIRILCLLYEHPHACVNEIADGINASVATTSHHLQVMKEAGLLTCDRNGQTMCYAITASPFSKKLKSIICE